MIQMCSLFCCRLHLEWQRKEQISKMDYINEAVEFFQRHAIYTLSRGKRRLVSIPNLVEEVTVLQYCSVVSRSLETRHYMPY